MDEISYSRQPDGSYIVKCGGKTRKASDQKEACRVLAEMINEAEEELEAT